MLHKFVNSDVTAVQDESVIGSSRCMILVGNNRTVTMYNWEKEVTNVHVSQLYRNAQSSTAAYSRFLINFSNLRILLDSGSAASDVTTPAAGLHLSSAALPAALAGRRVR